MNEEEMSEILWSAYESTIVKFFRFHPRKDEILKKLKDPKFPKTQRMIDQWFKEAELATWKYLHDLPWSIETDKDGYVRFNIRTKRDD